MDEERAEEMASSPAWRMEVEAARFNVVVRGGSGGRFFACCGSRERAWGEQGRHEMRAGSDSALARLKRVRHEEECGGKWGTRVRTAVVVRAQWSGRAVRGRGL